MTTAAIHRVIEQHAASRGESTAILEGERSMSYRALNQGGNTVARRLMTHGLRRGSHVWVHMPRGAELALVLLGILKAGGSYTWIDPARTASTFPCGISIGGKADSEDQFLHVDSATLLQDATGASSPNLPVVTRGSDVACVLRDDEGSPVILVPHDALTALRHTQIAQPAIWTGEPGALDLWLALMTGGAAQIEPKVLEAAAA